MKLRKHIEQHGGRVVLVADDSRLPTTEGRWQYAGDTDDQAGGGPRIGEDSDTILEGVERDGYFALPKA
jgi:hypothetical protein